MVDIKKSEDGYLQEGAMVTNGDGDVGMATETQHIHVNAEFPDGEGTTVVDFTDDNGDDWLTDGHNVVYRVDP
jgi:hypothetical protein